jgi:hypothetical protein
MVDRIEETHVTSHGDHLHQERIVVDEATESRRTAYRVSSFIWLLFGLLIGMIGLRVILKLIGANPGAPFAALVYQATELFLWPFYGLIGTPSVNNLVLDTPAIIAMLFYMLVGWAVARLSTLLLLRP